MKNLKTWITSAALIIIGVNVQAQLSIEDFERDFVVSKANTQLIDSVNQVVNQNNVPESQFHAGYRGTDPVSYFNDATGPLAGTSEFTYDHGGILYQFATQENMNEFISNPTKYEPTYGGFCAFAMMTGNTVPVDRRYYSFDLDDEGNKLRIHFFVSDRAMWSFNNRRLTRRLTSAEIIEKMLVGDADSKTIIETVRTNQTMADGEWVNILENDLPVNKF